MTDNQDHLHLHEVIFLVRELTPELSDRQLEDIVMTVAPGTTTRRLLVIKLRKLPGILSGEHKDVPRTIQQLAHALSAAGATRVVLPTCEGCGRAVYMPNKAPGGGRHCPSCAAKSNAANCAVCGRIKRVYTSVGKEHYCRNCWHRDPRSYDKCSECGQEGPVIQRRPRIICRDCYAAPEKQCGHCQRVGRPAVYIDGTCVCSRCYSSMRRPRPCPRCQREVFLTSFVNGEAICANCAGEPVRMACPGCGTITQSRKSHFCSSCRRPSILKEFLSGSDEEVPQNLQPLFDYLLTHHQKAASLEIWLQRGKCASILREIADRTLPLEPDAIIQRANADNPVVFLLSLLSHSGTIPELDVQKARFDFWLKDWFKNIDDPQDRLILKRYARWSLLSTADNNPPPNNRVGSYRSRYNRYRSILKECRALLYEIRSHGDTTMSFPQSKLEAYLSGSSSQRDALARFTRWLRQERLTKLRVGNRNHQLEGTHGEANHRWMMAKKFLSDTPMDVRSRAGGLLVLLYGMQLTRVVSLRTSQVNVQSDIVTLTIGSDPIEVPDRLGTTLAELADDSAKRCTSWLFPGRIPGSPLSTSALSKRLRREGFQNIPARSFALMDLARQMHPRVLSDLLGISTTSANAWWRIAGGDWTSYPTLRLPEE